MPKRNEPEIEWILLLGALGVGGYLLYRELATKKPVTEPVVKRPTRPGVTVAAERPLLELPTGAKSVGDVEDRFKDIIIFNWRAGYWDETKTLAAVDLLLSDLERIVGTDALGRPLPSPIKKELMEFRSTILPHKGSSA